MSLSYVSLFSGIEAASVAWQPLGWKALAFAEIEPFPCAVLAERFPDVPNLGDVSQVDWSAYAGSTDVVVGGSPCQSFSIAGGRAGLDDQRGKLMLEFVRAVRDIRPWWVVWENVPGVLSQDGGRAFATLLRELEQLRYGLAWRVLDAQFFGVAQRRRRVFLVGSLGSLRACSVLFEPGCVPGGAGQSKAKRQALTRAAEQCAGGEGGGVDGPLSFKYIAGAAARGIALAEDVTPTLTADWHQPAVAFPWAQGGSFAMADPDEELSPTLCAHPYNTPAVALSQYGDVAGTLTARHDSSPCADRGQNVICMAGTQSHSMVDEDVCGTLTASMHREPPVAAYAVRMREGKPGGGKGPLVSEDVSLTLATGSDQTLFHEEADGWTVRRLTPLECERLQGFPDNWTAIPGAKDGPRYKAIGNSMAVPVMRWIGERIAEVDGEMA